MTPSIYILSQTLGCQEGGTVVFSIYWIENQTPETLSVYSLLIAFMAPILPFAISLWVPSLFDSNSGQMIDFSHWNVSKNDLSTVLGEMLVPLCYHFEKDIPGLTCWRRR